VPQDDKVFLDYTQEELDWQYDHSKRFPDTGLFNKERADASAVAQTKVKGLLNVPYGDDDREVVDIFSAEGTNKAPVIVFMHGGAWTRGSKEGYSFPAAEFVPRGVAWVATEFTNVPQGTLSNQVRQNRDAVAWVYNNAMCGMSLITDWEKLYGLPKNLIKGAIAISGMYDLEAVYLSYRNNYLGLSEEDWQENSPIRHIPKECSTPLLIGCSEHDTAEFHRQPETFLKAWQAAGHKGEYIELMDRHHFSGSLCYGEPDHPLFQKICDMIGI